MLSWKSIPIPNDTAGRTRAHSSLQLQLGKGLQQVWSPCVLSSDSPAHLEHPSTDTVQQFFFSLPSSPRTKALSYKQSVSSQVAMRFCCSPRHCVVLGPVATSDGTHCLVHKLTQPSLGSKFHLPTDSSSYSEGPISELSLQSSTQK